MTDILKRFYPDTPFNFVVELYDSNGILKTKERKPTHHLAWASGENWKMLRAGNNYKIIEPEQVAANN